jgi:hypothetical protein
MLLRNLFEAAAPDADAAFAFGRFNPAHQGHIEVYKAVQAAGNKWFIGTNPSTHGPNDPLSFEEKSAWMQAIYPPIKGHILPEQSVVTLASKLYEMLGDDKTIAYVTDSNDWAWAGKLLNDYNGKEGPHGYYNFRAIKHVESPRVSSATALRTAARANDEAAFYAASGTNPKLTVNGQSYFDTVVAAVSANPEKPKKVAKKKEPAVTESLGTMPTTEYVKGIYAAAAENGMGAPDVEAVRKQMVLAANGEVDIMATMQKALRVFQDPKFKQMLADLDALIKKAEIGQGVAEVSKSTLDRYVTKAVDAHGHADFAARQSKNDPSKRSYHVDQKKTAEKRRQGISRALDRMSKEGVAEGGAWHNTPQSAMIGINGKKTMSKSASDSKYSDKSFTYQGHTIKFKPNKREIYKGGDLLHSKDGDYSNPTKKHLSVAHADVGRLMAKREGAPIVVAQATIDIRNPKKDQSKQRYMGDIVPDTKPPSTEKRGVKGRPGQRPMPKYDESVDLKTSLQELSNDMLGKYKKAAGADAKKADAAGDFKRGDKRFKGINKATVKQFDNDAKKNK